MVRGSAKRNVGQRNRFLYRFWNQGECRLRAGWRLLIQIALNLGGAIGLVLLADRLVGLPASDSPWRGVWTYALFLIATLVSVGLAARFLDRRRFSDLGAQLGQRGWWADLGFGLLLAILTVVPTVFIAAAAGYVEIEAACRSGLPGMAFVPAALVALFQYVCVGTFEELARGYHVRNTLEGLSGSRLGLLGAAIGAVTVGSLVSVAMHRGHPLFLLLVLLDTAVYGLSYLLTGRIAIALGNHILWDVLLTTVLALDVDPTTNIAAAFIVRPAASLQGGSVEGGLFLWAVLGLLLYEALNVVLLLGWVRLRYGRVGLTFQKHPKQV